MSETGGNIEHYAGESEEDLTVIGFDVYSSYLADAIAHFNSRHDLDRKQQMYCLVEEMGELSEAINEEHGVEHVTEEIADVLFVTLSIGIMETDDKRKVREQLADTVNENLQKSTDQEGDKITKQ